MDLSNRKNQLLTITFVIVAIIEIIAEAYVNTTIIFVMKPLIPILLMVLYFYSSSNVNNLFYVVMFFSVLTNLFFIPNTETFLFYGVIAFTFHRIFLLYLIFKIVKIKDYIPFLLSVIPMAVIFFYLFAASDVPQNSYYLVFLHNIFAAILGGIAISNYVMQDNKINSLLLISVLLFLGLQLVIYVEKYYLSTESLNSLRPLAMILNASAFYAFYRFVVESEKNIK